MRSSCVLALDLDASGLTCARFAADSRRGLRMEDCFVEPVSCGSATEPEWAREVARGVRALAARLDHRGEVRIAVPGHLAFTKCACTPAIGGASRRRVVEFEAAQNIPHALDEVWWDHWVIDADSADLEILLMASKRSAIAGLCAAFAVPAWRLERATPAAAALHGAVRWNYPDATAPVLLVSIGARSTHLVVSGEKRLWLRTLALGADSFAHTVPTPPSEVGPRAATPMQGAEVGANAARVAAAEWTALESGAAMFCSRLELEIARTLAGFAGHRPGESIGQFYLAGGGTWMPTLADFLRERFAVRVERFDPLRRVSNRAAAPCPAEAEAGLAVAVGLAADLVSPAAVVGNLLPPEVRRRADWRRRQPIWLAAAALVLAALLLVAWHFQGEARTTQAALLERQQQLQVLRDIAQRKAETDARLALVREELAAIRALAKTRGAWVAFLDDLQTRLGEVEDVWLDELTWLDSEPAQGGTVPMSGAADGVRRLRVGGRLLDANHPSAKPGEESYARARKLLASLAASPFVIALSEERFDDRQPAILRFSCELTTRGLGTSSLP